LRILSGSHTVWAFFPNVFDLTQFSSGPTVVGGVLSFPGTVEASMDFQPGNSVLPRPYPPKAESDSFQV
jgi:hypothetical protein